MHQKSTERWERADGPESADPLERAAFTEGTDITERAAIDESTDVLVRAGAAEETVNIERPHTYILIGQTPVPEPDQRKWSAWFGEREDAGIVARTEVPGGLVSTVFLGVDHSHFRGGPPLLFETAYFKGEEVEDMYRCATWLEAEAQHARVVASLASRHGREHRK